MERTQGPTERIDIFVTKVLMLNSKLTRPLGPFELIELLTINLHPKYRNGISLNDVTSVDALLCLGRDLEFKWKANSLYKPPKHASESIEEGGACFSSQVKKNSESPRDVTNNERGVGGNKPRHCFK